MRRCRRAARARRGAGVPVRCHSSAEAPSLALMRRRASTLWVWCRRPLRWGAGATAAPVCHHASAEVPPPRRVTPSGSGHGVAGSPPLRPLLTNSGRA